MGRFKNIKKTSSKTANIFDMPPAPLVSSARGYMKEGSQTPVCVCEGEPGWPL